MFLRLLTFMVFLTTACTVLALGQDAAPPTHLFPEAPQSVEARTIALTVPKDTPLQIALDKEVRIKKAGQLIHGRIVQPVYAFDKLVVPVGARVNGRIAKIEVITRKNRVLGILNGDFTPTRKVEVQLDELVLAQGRHIPFQAVITPGSGQVMQLVSAKDEKKKTAKSATSEKVQEAKREAKRTWQDAMQQVKEPGKVHRLERYVVNQLPVHPQYVKAGTIYFAELQDAIDFGSEPLTPNMMSAIGTPPPAGSLVHALLTTPLDSATTRKGSNVEAVLSQPLFDGDRLILPEGSRLKGSVVQVQPARRLHHNGQLRIVFRELVPPDGLEQKVVAGLEAVQSGENDHVKLDSEGGTEATSPKTRYLSTALSLALASTALRQHGDADDLGGTQQGGVGGGAAGFKLVGIALSALVKSQPLGIAMGAYGASRSVYVHFIARGHDVVFPRNTALEIGFGSRGSTVLPTQSPDNDSKSAPKQQ
jgi:type IV secretory pathway VirB10-like protein